MRFIVFLILFICIYECEVTNIFSESRSDRTFQSIKMDGFDGSWQNIDGASCSDSSPMITSRVFALSNSEMLKITNFGFDIPEDAQIASISAHFDVEILGSIPLSGFRESVIQLVADDGRIFTTPVSNVSWSQDLQRISYPLPGEDPLWGNAIWNVSDVNSHNFGIAVRARCGHTDATGAIRCVSLSVTYDETGDSKETAGTGTATTTATTTTKTTASPTIQMTSIPDTATIPSTQVHTTEEEKSGNTTTGEPNTKPYFGIFIVSCVIFYVCGFCIAIVSIVRRRWQARFKKPIAVSQKGGQSQSQFQSQSQYYNSKQMSNFGPRENIDDEIEGVIQIFSMIGKGSYGTVWKGKMGETSVACKCSNSVDDNSPETKKLMQELKNLRTLRNRHVISLCGTYHGPVGENYTHRFFIVTEFMENGNLKEFLQKNNDLSPEMLITVCTDIAKGMCYIVQNGFIHRDLAARNILISGSVAKENFGARISGMGKCEKLMQDKFFDRDQPVTLQNSQIKWMAPESINSSTYSVKSDIWSLAATMFEIWCKGSDPWPDLNAEKTKDFIIGGATLELPSSCTRELQILVDTMMDHNPSKRPTFFQVLILLNQIKKENFPSIAENWDELEVYEYKYQYK